MIVYEVERKWWPLVLPLEVGCIEKNSKREREGGGERRGGETAEGGKQGRNKANGRIASQEKE